MHQERIEENQTADAVGACVRGAADHGAAKRMADENYVAQVLHLEGRDDVFDMGRKPDIRGNQVSAVPEAGQGRREHTMARRPQALGDSFPAPAAMPRAMHQQVGRTLFCSRGMGRGALGGGVDWTHRMMPFS